MPKEKDDRVKFIFRLPKDYHQALRRMACEVEVPMGEILCILIEKSIPKKYFGDVYNKQESDK